MCHEFYSSLEDRLSRAPRQTVCFRPTYKQLTFAQVGVGEPFYIERCGVRLVLVKVSEQFARFIDEYETVCPISGDQPVSQRSKPVSAYFED